MTCYLGHHRIVINNFPDEDRELVTHPIVLITGKVLNVCECDKLIVWHNDEPVHSSLCRVSPTNGNFKCVVRLHLNENQLKFSYCNADTAICTIVYQPRCTRLGVTPIYLICRDHDGRFQAEVGDDNNSAAVACQKIDLAMEVLQCLFAEKLKQSGFQRKTFHLKSPCQSFCSKLSVADAWTMSPSDLWSYFATELITAFGGSETEKFVAFIGCTKFEGIDKEDYSYAEIKDVTKAHAALGGGGLALFGTGCLYTWPTRLEDMIDCFKCDKRVDVSYLMDDSNYRRTYGGCYATTLGSVSHEVGHIFDLGHTAEGIMGAGFDLINRVFTIDNRTEALPDRIVVQKPAIENPNARFTKIKRPGSFLIKYQEQKEFDSVFFVENCAVTLNLHKWFNDYEDSLPSHIVIDFENRTVCAERYPIRLIESRSPMNALVERHFVLDEDVFEFEFPDDMELESREVIVIDSQGNICKAKCD